eukprot:c20829_g1_i5 orf=63-323(-)
MSSSQSASALTIPCFHLCSCHFSVSLSASAVKIPFPALLLPFFCSSVLLSGTAPFSDLFSRDSFVLSDELEVPWQGQRRSRGQSAE